MNSIILYIPNSIFVCFIFCYVEKQRPLYSMFTYFPQTDSEISNLSFDQFLFYSSITLHLLFG